MSEFHQKNIFVVLGIARSGTSVIAKALHTLGIYLGNQLNPSNKWNPKGFWEDADVVYNINRKIFAEIHYEHGVFRKIEAAELASESIQKINTLAAELLQSRLHQHQNWGFKDPNTVRVLPFWQHIFAKLHLKENYIIALRNPLESAESYQSKSFGCNYEKTFMMWLLHLIPAIDQTHGKNRVVVHYDLMLKNPRFQLERLQKKLNIEGANTAEIDAYANSFLDKNLRHSEYHNENLASHPASQIVPLCLKAYDLLLKLARDEITDDESFKLAWNDIVKEFNAIYPLYFYIDLLQEKNKELKKSLHKIHRSFAWKILAPVRSLQDKLSKQRKKRKENRLTKMRNLSIEKENKNYA